MLKNCDFNINDFAWVRFIVGKGCFNKQRF